MTNLVLIIAALALLGLCLIVVGVGMLAGLPWALIAAGVVLMGGAGFLRRGLTAHG